MPPWAWAGLGVLGIAGTIAGVWLLGRAFDPANDTAPPSRIERKRGTPRRLSQEELEDYLTADEEDEG